VYIAENIHCEDRRVGDNECWVRTWQWWLQFVWIQWPGIRTEGLQNIETPVGAQKRFRSSKASPGLCLRPRYHMRYGATKPPGLIFSKTGNVHKNVILRHVRIINVAVESNKRYIFWVCICRTSYPACNSHTLF
jgi:hypothetical protein